MITSASPWTLSGSKPGASPTIPDVWVMRCRTVISFHVSGVPSRNLLTLSSRLIAVLDQEQDACGDELLADRANLVDGFRSGRNVEFNIRQAVPFDLNDLPVLYDSERNAGKCCLFISALT